MANLLESTCYEILCLLHESIRPPLPHSDLYLQQESAVCGLTSFVEALRRRDSSIILPSHHQLLHRLFNLAQLILLTDIGELTSMADNSIFDLHDLCYTLQQALSSANRQVHITFDSRLSDILLDAECEDNATHSSTSSQIDSNKGYLKIGYLLETYVQCSKTKRKMKGVWRNLESVISEFEVSDTDRSCIALRRRLDEVVEMVGILAVVEDGTPLNCFLQPQVDDIFAALNEDTLKVRLSLGDRAQLAWRRLRRWLERFLIRVMHYLRCRLAAC